MWKSSIALRPYQLQALDGIEEAFKEHDRTLISIPTGGGKTLIFNTYALSKGYRTLVIAHRDELLEQAVEKFEMVGGNPEEAGYIRRGEWEEKTYTAASIQTLFTNLERIDGKKFDLVVVDEAHHTPAPTYQAVLERLIETNPDLKVLGVTATPFRSDKKNLKDFYEKLAYKIDIFELIKEGYLVPVKGKIVPLPVDMGSLRKVRTAEGEVDFSLKSISEAFNNEEVNRLIVQKWIEEAKGRKTIFYTSSLEHAKALCREFEREGIRAAYVDGRVPLQKRRELLSEFKRGRIEVLTNMNVLTEGFDDPEVECIAIVRPTKSLNLYAQIVGRGLRIAPKKEDCLILDYTGISRKHTVVGLPELFGLDGEASRDYRKGKLLQVGAVEKEGKKEIVVLVGEKSVEFTFEGKEANRYATVLGELVLLTAGRYEFLAMEKDASGYYTIYYCDTKSGCKSVLKERVAEDYAWTVLTALWKRFRDDWSAYYAERAAREKATLKQKKIITNAIRLGLIDFEGNVEELSKLEATNVIGWLFFNKYFQTTADFFIEEEKEGLRITDWRGKEIELTREEVVALIEFAEARFFDSRRGKFISSQDAEELPLPSEFLFTHEGIPQALQSLLSKPIPPELKAKIPEIAREV